MATPTYAWDANTDQTFTYTFNTSSVGNANPGFAFPSPNNDVKFSANTTLSSVTAKLFTFDVVYSADANVATINLGKYSYASNTDLQVSTVFGQNAHIFTYEHNQINNTNNIFATLNQANVFYTVANTTGPNTQLSLTTDERLYKTFETLRLAENADTDRYIEPKQRWVG